MIEIKNLTKIYGQGKENLCVLEDVSLSLQAGTFVVLLGPSGSGKSTLLNLIGMLDQPTQGQIFFDGQELTAIKSESKRSAVRLNKMGFVFQFDGLLPEFTLLENVAMPGLMHGKDKQKRAQELLDTLGIGQISHKMPSDLSGGEKQRAAIARALCNEPSLLLADEPTGNLDVARKEQVFKDFAALARQGLTILMVTHDVHAANFADVVYTLQDRKLIKTK
ncbi:MAG: ABC transporter ATP-binding protein [Elusimicrobiaceae bacterium]|nr:ABC transporter ATP-binding protein [Elusimicrobiaceae bacterium]MBR3899067.1 ABC transporter ATP-binding protein [Elusimicrobiaceae bacterium]